VSIPPDVDARIRYVRVIASRFAPIIMSGVSEEWSTEVSGRQEWLEFQRLIEQVNCIAVWRLGTCVMMRQFHFLSGLAGSRGMWTGSSQEVESI
jgi:hypothetical protein